MRYFYAGFMAVLLFLNAVSSSKAAIIDVSEQTGSAAHPYMISQSYASETDQVISSSGKIGEKAYINVADGVNFTDTVYSTPSPSQQTSNLHGSVLYAFNSVIHFGGNNVFSGNKFNSLRNTYGVIYAASPYRIGEYGMPDGAYSNEITFGANTLFENNSAVMGNVIVAEASQGGKNTISFGDDTQFKNNVTARNQVGNGGNGGVIMSTAYGVSGQESNNTFNFGNNILFEGNKGVLGGVILTDLWAQDNARVTNNFNFNGNVSFINNVADGAANKDTSELPENQFNRQESAMDKQYAEAVDPSLDKEARATGYGGVIYGEVYGLNDALADNYFNFYGTTLFSNNKSQGIGGAIVFMSEKDNEDNVNDIVNFAPQQKGQFIRFENNTGAGRLNSFYIKNTKINFDLPQGTYADIRDPIYATGNSQIIKNGDGGLYLWGDNSDFNGTMNINSGSLYAMFEENQTAAQAAADTLGQRKEFKLGGTLNFGADTLFRPMINQNRDKLAQLTMNKVNGASNATLIPYEISKLAPKDYVFANNYEGFNGFDTPLANLSVNGNTNVLLTVKRDLGGYQGLDPSVDVYRKSDLGFIDREVLDDIYLTGIVSDEIKDMFEVAGGSDYINYNNVHRATVRQFNRQIESRTHNQDSGASTSGHLWIDTSFNNIKKEQTHQESGYKYDPRGFALGYDYEFIPGKLTAGLAFSYSTGRAKILSGAPVSDHDDIDNYLGSFYGKYKNNNYYANWNLGGGYFKDKTQILSETINAQGKFNSSAWFANGETGYNLGNNYLSVEPFAGLEYTYLTTDSYNEKGTGARHFDKADWNIFEVPVGLRIAKAFNTEQFLVTPTASIAYARNFGDTGIKTNAAFIGASGVWQAASPSEKRDSLRAVASIKLNAKEYPLAFHAGYALDYRSDYEDQQLFLTLRWDI